MNKLIILTITAIVLVGVAVFLYSGDTVKAPRPSPEASEGTATPTPTPIPTVTEEAPAFSPETSPSPVTQSSRTAVTYSDSGYGPSTARISKGDTIIFENNRSGLMWTASAVHPTHKAYSDSDIAKCGTSEQVSIFDACKGYGSGESWEFQFNEQGTWKYHNHLQPNHTGTIIVE